MQYLFSLRNMIKSKKHTMSNIFKTEKGNKIIFINIKNKTRQSPRRTLQHHTVLRYCDKSWSTLDKDTSLGRSKRRLVKPMRATRHRGKKIIVIFLFSLKCTLENRQTKQKQEKQTNKQTNSSFIWRAKHALHTHTHTWCVALLGTLAHTVAAYGDRRRCCCCCCLFVCLFVCLVFRKLFIVFF